MNFAKAVQIIFDLEGGDKITNNPNDPGGLTKYGISKRAHPDVDIERLTEAAAANIYRDNYWFTVNAEMLPPALRLAVFDAAVNQGPKQAIWWLQAVVDVKVDGVIGPKTLQAIAGVPTHVLIEKFMAKRALHYASLDGFQHWGSIWMRRLFHVTMICAIYNNSTI